jgi:CRISPR-associated protein Cas6
VDGKRLLARPGHLVVRAPIERAPLLLALEGTEIQAFNSPLRVTSVAITPVRPAPTLIARLVFFQAAPDGPTFWRCLEEGLKALLHDPFEVMLLGRRVITIKGTILAGWGVKITGLSPADSLRLQGVGVGSGRRMGCGVFGAA